MGKITIGRVGSGEVGRPTLSGVTFDAAVRSEAIIGPDQTAHPVLLWVHELQEDTIELEGAPVDHVFYVLEGAIEGDPVVGQDGTMLVPHGTSATLRARGTTRLAHFHRSESHPGKPSRGGGTVEIVSDGSPEGRDPRTGMLYRIFYDSLSATSETWLHRTDFPAGYKGSPHLHTTDEIIFVIGGNLAVGTQLYPTGTALAINADTIYSFAVAEPYLSFINFRAVHSVIKGKTPSGPTPPLDEADYLRALPPAPPGGWRALTSQLSVA